MPMTFRSSSVNEILPSHQNPSFVGSLGHEVSPAAPSGVIQGLATVVDIPREPATTDGPSMPLHVPTLAEPDVEPAPRQGARWLPLAATPAPASAEDAPATSAPAPEPMRTLAPSPAVQRAADGGAAARAPDAAGSSAVTGTVGEGADAPLTAPPPVAPPAPEAPPQQSLSLPLAAGTARAEPTEATTRAAVQRSATDGGSTSGAVDQPASPPTPPSGTEAPPAPTASPGPVVPPDQKLISASSGSDAPAVASHPDLAPPIQPLALQRRAGHAPPPAAPPRPADARTDAPLLGHPPTTAAQVDDTLPAPATPAVGETGEALVLREPAPVQREADGDGVSPPVGTSALAALPGPSAPGSPSDVEGPQVNAPAGPLSGGEHVPQIQRESPPSAPVSPAATTVAEPGAREALSTTERGDAGDDAGLPQGARVTDVVSTMPTLSPSPPPRFGLGPPLEPPSVADGEDPGGTLPLVAPPTAPLAVEDAPVQRDAFAAPASPAARSAPSPSRDRASDPAGAVSTAGGGDSGAVSPPAVVAPTLAAATSSAALGATGDGGATTMNALTLAEAHDDGSGAPVQRAGDGSHSSHLPLASPPSIDVAVGEGRALGVRDESHAAPLGGRAGGTPALQRSAEAGATIAPTIGATGLVPPPPDASAQTTQTNDATNAPPGVSPSSPTLPLPVPAAQPAGPTPTSVQPSPAAAAGVAAPVVPTLGSSPGSSDAVAAERTSPAGDGPPARRGGGVAAPPGEQGGPSSLATTPVARLAAEGAPVQRSVEGPAMVLPFATLTLAPSDTPSDAGPPPADAAPAHTAALPNSAPNDAWTPPPMTLPSPSPTTPPSTATPPSPTTVATVARQAAPAAPTTRAEPALVNGTVGERRMPLVSMQREARSSVASSPTTGGSYHHAPRALPLAEAGGTPATTWLGGPQLSAPPLVQPTSAAARGEGLTDEVEGTAAGGALPSLQREAFTGVKPLLPAWSASPSTSPPTAEPVGLPLAAPPAPPQPTGADAAPDPVVARMADAAAAAVASGIAQRASDGSIVFNPPAAEAPVVQRREVETTTTAAPAPAMPEPAPAPDLDDLADKLYDKIHWKLATELRLGLERSGRGAGLRR